MLYLLVEFFLFVYRYLFVFYCFIDHLDVVVKLIKFIAKLSLLILKRVIRATDEYTRVNCVHSFIHINKATFIKIAI